MEDFENNNNNVCFDMDNTDFDFCGCMDPATGTMSCFENQSGNKDFKVSPPNCWTTFTTELMESGLSESQRQGLLYSLIILSALLLSKIMVLYFGVKSTVDTYDSI